MAIKVKFYDCSDDGYLKVLFMKKQGDLLDFYKMLKEMQSYLDEYLVSSV